MTNIKDRIRLAEAMGWRLNDWQDANTWGRPDGTGAIPADMLPDPLTDANDDYEVLEWYRSDTCRWNDKQHNEFCVLVRYGHQYQIGDYARAVLNVLATTPADSDPTSGA